MYDLGIFPYRNQQAIFAVYQRVAGSKMDYFTAKMYYIRMQHKLLNVLQADADPHYRSIIEKTFEGYYGVQSTDSGGVDLTIDGRRYELEGEWVWCTYPGPDFRYAPLTRHGYWSHRYITFTGSRVEAWVAQGLLPFAPQRLSPDFHLGERMDILQTLIRRTDYLGQLKAMNVLEALLIELGESRAQVSERPIWIELLVEQLQLRLDSQPDYTALAATYHISESTLRRQFKEHLGMPIHTYLLQQRIAKARELLASSRLPLKEIAACLGYHDHYFFSRQFRQYTGFAPSVFRRNAQA